MVPASLSQDGFHCESFWDVGRTYGLASPPSFLRPLPNSSGLVLQDILWTGISSLLSALPEFSRLVFSSSAVFFFLKNKFIYLFLAVLGLCCYARAFSSCGERGLLFVALRRLLIVVASLAVEHGL